MRTVCRVSHAVLVGVGIAALSTAPAVAGQIWVKESVTIFTPDADDFRGQGVTTDGTQWIFSGTDGLERTDFNLMPTQRVSPAIDGSLANPNALAYKGLNHIGDIDTANGTLYISLDSSTRDPITRGRYETPVIALYNANDLSYTGKAFKLSPPKGTDDIASWVAVDAAKGLGYGMAYDNASEVIIYDLADWSFKSYLGLSKPVDQAQGCKVRKGYLYCASDDDQKMIRRISLDTGLVEDLFSIKIDYPNGGQETEGLSFRETADGVTLNILNRDYPDDNDESKNFKSFFTYRLVQDDPVDVAEPATAALLVGGLAGLVAIRRRRRT